MSVGDSDTCSELSRVDDTVALKVVLTGMLWDDVEAASWDDLPAESWV